MKIIFIRHAEPHYEIDNLTEKGKREAALLAKRVKHWRISQAYASPLGRAQATAQPSLDALGIQLDCLYPSPAEDIIKPLDPKKCLVYPWLREFSLPVNPASHPLGKRVAWDYTPHFLSEHSELYDPEDWFLSPIYEHMSDDASVLDPIKTPIDDNVRALYASYYQPDPNQSPMQLEYEWICQRFDQILAQWGYVREGYHYRTDGSHLPSDRHISCDGHTIEHMQEQRAELQHTQEEEPLLVFFCHLGIASVLMSHLINSTPALLQHGFFLAPSSVSIFSTEERIPGQALFRCQTAGDCSHLTIANEPISFYGAFDMPFQG